MPMTYAFMASSPVGLQLLIDICANYGFENDLLFNRSKSVCMVVKPRGRNVSTPLMFLNGDALEYVDIVKYLGDLLSQDMKDDADMSRHLRSFYARSNVIFRKFHHCSASIKVNLIKTYCAHTARSFGLTTPNAPTINYALHTITLTGEC